jgi:hypothetical protein
LRAGMAGSVWEWVGAMDMWCMYRKGYHPIGGRQEYFRNIPVMFLTWAFHVVL